MEAKDTVMDEKQLGKYEARLNRNEFLSKLMNEGGIKLNIDEILEAQAEISFKAGIREGMREAYLLDQSRVLGINEFIDYSIDGLKQFRKMVLYAFEPYWQAKLKEWGVE